jgi:glutamate racemase
MYFHSMQAVQAIGVFDSGVGGTSIWKELRKTIPNESTVYLADSANAPYGNKSKEEILELSIKNTEALIAMDCKLIVVACNTATTNAIDYLRTHYTIPFIGIEPAIKPAALQTQSKSIGILATKGTLSSALFHQTTAAFTKDIQLIEVVGEGLVPLIEAGKEDSKEMRELLHTYLQPMISANIDHLVLGCSHYPYLIPQLKEILPPNVRVIDSGAAVAKQTLSILGQKDLLAPINQSTTHRFYTNSSATTLKRLMQDHSEITVIAERDF